MFCSTRNVTILTGLIPNENIRDFALVKIICKEVII